MLKMFVCDTSHFLGTMYDDGEDRQVWTLLGSISICFADWSKKPYSFIREKKLLSFIILSNFVEVIKLSRNSFKMMVRVIQGMRPLSELGQVILG